MLIFFVKNWEFSIKPYLPCCIGCSLLTLPLRTKLTHWIISPTISQYPLLLGDVMVHSSPLNNVHDKRCYLVLGLSLENGTKRHPVKQGGNYIILCFDKKHFGCFPRRKHVLFVKKKKNLSMIHIYMYVS